MPKMKLSDAILKGCVGTEQCFGEYFEDDRKKCCAIGAAIIGSELSPWRIPSIRDLESYFGVPPGTCRDIAGWNDLDHLTREEIAAKLKERGL